MNLKIIRYKYNNRANYGILEEGGIIKKINGSIYDSSLDYSTDQTIKLQDITYLSPCEPTKIIGIGLNYTDHIEAAGLNIPEVPYIFFRPLSCLNSHNGKVIISNPDHHVQFEGELAVVIGRKCFQVEPEEAGSYIKGYTCVNDITDKTLFLKDGHFGRGKAFDTHCPIGPLLETELDINELTIITTINGEVKQNGTIKNMVFPINYLISFLSNIMTMYPGDLILTGSPKGVEPLSDGDIVEVSIPGIGTLSNQIYCL